MTAGDRYNLAVDLVDRPVILGRGDRTALLYQDSQNLDSEPEAFTYRRLSLLSNRFAHALASLGVGRGDAVFFRLPNHPAFYFGALGCSKIGALFVPSSTQFRAGEIAYRLRDSGAVVAVTTEELLPELERAAGEAPQLREILVVDLFGEPPAGRGRTGLRAALDRARDHFRPLDTAADEPAFVAYTSGTTGDPKGIVHLHRYARSYDYLVRDWHGYTEDTVCACPAEIGWMLPVASTFLFAFRAGCTVVLHRERSGRFQPAVWLETIQRFGVTSFVGTPTVYRMFLACEERGRFDTSTLRTATSAGEPLPPDTLARARELLGTPPLDGLGMSECMVYAHQRAGEEPTPGSCGRAGAGLRLAVLDDELRPVADGEEGVLCLERASHPGLMRGYLGKPEQTAAVFRDEWYWSGDVVVRDREGRFWFRGRADDVMNCSGYRISPFEVESALQSHPAVHEAAAVESPDALRGSVVKAFCTLRPGHEPGDALAADIARHARALLAPFKTPRRIEFVAELPKTQSGKILRRVLRERERGGAPGR